VNEMEVLGAAIKKAGSSDPLKVGKALDGMQWKNPMGTVTMRADNHQLLQPMFISVLDSGTKHVFPDVNMGFREISRIEPEQTKMATTCKFPNAPR
jgi:branched-chain amino acid transport system substrate-binding protein